MSTEPNIIELLDELLKNEGKIDHMYEDAMYYPLVLRSLKAAVLGIKRLGEIGGVEVNDEAVNILMKIDKILKEDI